jgi:VanZ family protein
MLLIYSGSADTASGQRTSRLLGPLLHWLFPGLSPVAVDVGVTLIRKCAHVSEFAVLALLAWHALHRPVRGMVRPWSRAQALGAFGIACGYAASDELHQLFVPNREASVRDVLIDAVGAALGLLALWLWRRWRARAAVPTPPDPAPAIRPRPRRSATRAWRP